MKLQPLEDRIVVRANESEATTASGLVIPDTYRVDRSGQVLERSPGRKQVAIRSVATGGTVEEKIDAARAEQLCLDDGQLAELNQLALRCEQVYGPARDIEWAFADGTLYLLQCRAVTRAGSSRPSGAVAEARVAEGPAEVLERVPLFANLNHRDIERIARLFKERRFSAGETITKEGAGGAAFFVIDAGEATVSVRGKPIATLKAGEYFGEIALIDEGARSATITASTDLVCYGLTFWEFRPLVQTNATIAWNLLQTLAKRLRTAQEE